MDFTRRDLLRTAGAGSFPLLGSCLFQESPSFTPGRSNGNGGGGGGDGGVSPAPTPAVEDIPEGGQGENFSLVAHNPLMDNHQYVEETYDVPRGSNGDIAIAGDCVYVGSLVAQQPPLIVDISDPTTPDVIGPVPDAIPGVANGIEGIEAIGDVMIIDHREPLGDEFAVPDGEPTRGLSVYDVSEPREPSLVTRYDYEGDSVHAATLWRDPEDPDRILAVQSFWDRPNIRILDLTGCPGGDCDPTVVASWGLEAQVGMDAYTHEAVFSTDGQRLYTAQWEAGTFLLDSSSLMASLRDGETCNPDPPAGTDGDGNCLTLLNPTIEDRVDSSPPLTSDNHHIALKVPGRPYLLVTGESTGPRWNSETESIEQGSCPGAFTRLVYIGEDEHEHYPGEEPTALRGDLYPETVGVFGLPEQQIEHCTEDGWEEGVAPPQAWLSPHYATVFPDLAFVTYSSAGIRAIDISNPFTPLEAGYYFSNPVDEVRWTSYGVIGDPDYNDEDELIRRSNPVPPHMFAFSFPIVHNGYIIYADVHSGLYVLEYTGPYADQLSTDGTCLSGTPGAYEPGTEPCPPYGETSWDA